MILSIDQKISKKGIAILSIVLAALSSLSPFAIDSYAPAMPFMAKFFGCSLSDIELSMSIYLLGYAIGQFFGGPVSDNFGRKPVVLIGLLCFMISSYMISQSTQLTELYFFRFLQAVGGGFSIVVSMAIARDFFEGKELAKRISYISMIMMAAPLLAPAVGTLLLKLFSWEAIFSFLCIYSIFVLSLIMIFIPETRKKQSSKGLIRKNTNQLLASFNKRTIHVLHISSSFRLLGYVCLYHRIIKTIHPIFSNPRRMVSSAIRKQRTCNDVAWWLKW